MRRGAVVITVAALAALATLTSLAALGAQPALAHAGVDHTAPRNGAVIATAPAAIVVTFDEPVQLDSARLTGSSGAQLPSTARVAGASIVITPASRLPRGPIAASWKATSDDGHQVTGTIAFVVGPAPRTGSPLVLSLSPALPATLSGGAPGPLTLDLGPTISRGDVTWTSADVPEPISWTVHRQSGRAVARGVLPSAGAWTMTAALIRRDGSVVVTTGTAVLRSG